MLFVENPIPALNGFFNEGQRTALVTLVGVEGSSPRPVGSQLGVAADGRSVGMITGGCAEKAIVAEAIQCLDNNENKIIRYGADSPYLDVVLPCGAGIDLYIETQSCDDIIREIHALQKTRALALMTVSLSNLSSRVSTMPDTASGDAVFVKTYEPDYRIFAFGEGANLVSFCTLAGTSGIAVEAFSPDEDALAFLHKSGINGRHIHLKTDFTALAIDKYTAIVTLFHEHDWEQNILHAALSSQADYIGALGSRVTHQARLERLAAMPATTRSPDIIRGPVGLNIGAQNPNEIAISIIAEIIEKRRRRSS